MKKIMLLFLLFTVIGCASTQIPTYVKEQKPFVRRFYADHQRAKAATLQALVDLGWKVDKELEPQTYEVDPERLEQLENILLVEPDYQRQLLKLQDTKQFVVPVK